MGLKDLLVKKESLISIDIGSSSIKLVEFDVSGSTPSLVNIGFAPMDVDVFSGNVITKGERASEQISSLLESNGVEDKRVVTAMPGPSVFTKKIKMQKMELADLTSNIQFEAGNFIPHSIDAVKLDFHIIGESGKNQLDIMVVAVKNEIIDSFVDCISLAGLEAAIVDVDYFALQNIFEVNYPEMASETVALISIGARYSSINICREGETLFTGDISMGGKMVTDAIATELNVSNEEAEQMKKEAGNGSGHADGVIAKNVEHIASEFNRQLSFFWSASGAEEGIDRILLTGGGSLVKGLKEELADKTGLECDYLDPLKEVDCEAGFDSAYLKQIAPQMAVGLGMAMRIPGDRVIPEGL